MQKRETLTDRLLARLVKLGVSKQKAKQIAKGLLPTVRSAIKAESLAEKGVDVAEPVKGKAIKINGHDLLLNLPVVDRDTWQSAPVKGVELLRVMDGLSSRGTYLVAAVKGETGIVAVRQLSKDLYNVKFYPNLADWGFTQARFHGATDFLQREWYERFHCNEATLEMTMEVLRMAGRGKSRRPLMDRFKSIAGTLLEKAFSYLHKKAVAAA